MDTTDWFRAQRERADLSVNAIARALSLSPQAYGGWERRGTRPAPQHLAHFCEITGADIREAMRLVYGVAIPGYLNIPLSARHANESYLSRASVA